MFLKVSLQREALTKVMQTLYFLAKEEIAHTTFSSLVDSLETTWDVMSFYIYPRVEMRCTGASASSRSSYRCGTDF